MIVPPTGVRVLIATKPVDFRKGAIGLAAIVEAELKLERKRRSIPTCLAAVKSLMLAPYGTRSV